MKKGNDMEKKKKNINDLQALNHKDKQFRTFYDLVSLILFIMAVINLWLSIQRLSSNHENLDIIYAILNIFSSLVFIALIVLYVFFTRKKINQRIDLRKELINNRLASLDNVKEKEV